MPQGDIIEEKIVVHEVVTILMYCLDGCKLTMQSQHSRTIFSHTSEKHAIYSQI